ncbi:MAG: thymidylate kinase [Nitrospirales bacterium]|nr:MAG: thymidylate kinase [Nitrospirales bacterium]
MGTAHTRKKTHTRRLSKRSGIFLTFEGIEGSGKTTQCHRLATTLTTFGHTVLETREPGGTPCAEKIRTLLLENNLSSGKQESITAECETALVLAARAQHIRHHILPALANNTIVLCDRFTDSTLAYQGFGRKLDMKILATFNDFITQGLTPDLTFLFDLPIQEGLARRKRDKNQNRLDRESQAFHSRVRRGFLAIAAQYPRRIIIINGREKPENIAQVIEHTVINLLQKRARVKT